MKADIVNRFVIDQITRNRLQKRITVEELAQGSYPLGLPLEPPGGPLQVLHYQLA